MTADVRVIYRKYDGSLHWHLTMRRLGEDLHGTWLGQYAGSTMRKGDGPLVPIPHAHVGLLPRAGSWTAWFNGEPEAVEIYCDVTTVPRWIAPDEVDMIDLDLDVCRMRADGSVRLLDEDEFAEHQVRYGYPAHVVDEAERAASWLYTALAGGDQPFAGAYQQWLSQVC